MWMQLGTNLWRVSFRDLKERTNIPKLSSDRYFLLTDEEAEKAWGSNYREFWDDQAGGYLGG